MDTNLTSLPPVSSLKAQAKRLRQSLAGAGNEITHSRALEVIAHQYGARDWNTLAAFAPKHRLISDLKVGDHLSGRYLGHRLEGTLLSISFAGEDRFKLSIQFDQKIDVVASDHFSGFRSRVTATVHADGRTREQTSEGTPHLTLTL